MRWLSRSTWVTLAIAAMLSPAAGAEPRLPIFDAHLHYSQPAWDSFPPEKAAKVLEASGVLRALVSSTPDDGTLALHRHDAARFQPVLRPYRVRIGPGDWTRDATMPGYLRERIDGAKYAGIGEFHLFEAAEANSRNVAHAVELAVARNIVLHIHADAKPIETIFEREPKVRILWAHVGMFESPETAARLFARHANLWVDVSYRAGDIAPGGTLSESWHALFLKFPDRVMIGSDTHATGRWENYASIIDDHRRWLAQLPPEIAKKIAYQNAVALFGSGGLAELER